MMNAKFGEVSHMSVTALVDNMTDMLLKSTEGVNVRFHLNDRQEFWREPDGDAFRSTIVEQGYEGGFVHGFVRNEDFFYFLSSNDSWQVFKFP